MSADEGHLELDDDDNFNGASSATFGKGRKRMDYCVMGSRSAAAEAMSVEKPSSLSEVKSIPLAQVATSSGPTVLLASQSTSTTNEDAASKEPNATSPTVSFGRKLLQLSSQMLLLPHLALPLQTLVRFHHLVDLQVLSSPQAQTQN